MKVLLSIIVIVGKFVHVISLLQIITHNVPILTLRKRCRLFAEVMNENGRVTFRNHTNTRDAFIKNMLRLQTSSVVIGLAHDHMIDNALALEDELSNPMSKGIKKPYAPLENLLPATRVRLYIEEMLNITSELTQLPKEDTKTKKILITQLQELLLADKNFLKTPQEQSKSNLYLQQKTLDEWNKARQQETKNTDFTTKEITTNPIILANEAIIQWGQKDQFKRLRKRQQNLEKSNPIRAAFNAYTNNLIFGESYVFTGSKEEKSRRIRGDKLPDVTSVIRSDLDLRDLYRNQILTNIDDAKAELEYQLKVLQNKSNDNLGDDASIQFFDGTELLSLLKDANISCNKWFDFIPESDVVDAYKAVLME